MIEKSIKIDDVDVTDIVEESGTWGQVNFAFAGILLLIGLVISIINVISGDKIGAILSIVTTNLLYQSVYNSRIIQRVIYRYLKVKEG